MGASGSRFILKSRTPQLMQDLQRALQAREGIRGVATNPATGSITVDHDHGRYSTAGIFGLLEELDIIIDSAVGSERTPSVGFLAAVDDLSARLHAATGIPIDLKIVMPLAFLGAGIWSFAKKGLMLESVPGWLLLWFAFDMFVKLHPGHPDMDRVSADYKPDWS